MARQRDAIIDGVFVPGLKAVRLARALSQEDLAARAGVGRKTVMRGEGGKEIRVSSVRRLATALRVSPQRLQQQPPPSR
jgi:transcriptional regulator with XRE-family HTH domain